MRPIRTILLLLCFTASLDAAKPAPTAESDELVPLQFVNEDVRAVVSLYEKLTRFKIVIENTVQGKSPSLVISQ